jgi:RHS repeat-associated protein
MQISPRQCHRAAFFNVTLLLCWSASGSALAQFIEGKQSNGILEVSVDVEVPAFHGLEPDLGLAYHSGNDDGFVGVGWTLTGQSYIERASSGGGSPAYRSGDVFLLDGEELVPCTGLGGTHCTKHQNYHRIRRDESGDRWYVWDKDGTKSTYLRSYITSSGTFRWALGSEEDTSGNVVTYSYWADPHQNVYLDTIQYNGVVIKLWRENRTDDVSFANGLYVGSTRYRLKTIDVTVGGQRARAYKLEYSYGPSTGRSRLQKVTRYGTDALLDASGTVTGGTALPSQSFTYSSGAGGYPVQNWNANVGLWDPAASYLLGDVNGDGKADLVTIYRGTSDNKVWATVTHSNGVGFTFVAFNAPLAGWDATLKPYVTDVNGDGKADLVLIWRHDSDAFAQVHLSNGSGYPTRSFIGSVGGWNPIFKEYFADVNGDGKSDLVRIWKHPQGNAYAQVNLSNGAGYPSQASNLDVGGWNSIFRDYFADVNGDGKSDLVRIWKHPQGNAYAQVNLSDGGGFPTQASNGSVGGWNDNFHDYFADANGDGKCDLIRIYQNGSASFAQITLSLGSDFAAPSWNGSIGGWNPDLIRDYFVDVNGDNRADSVRLYKRDNNTFAQVRLFNGVGYPTDVFNGSVGGWEPSRIRDNFADVNGDGKQDLVRIYNNGSGTLFDANGQVNLSPGGAFPDLLASYSNGVGGRLSVSYAPSSFWINSYLPAGLVIPTVASIKTEDGRGVSNTATYYYSGGRWSDRDRQFLGFRYERAVLDTQGTTRETYYSQALSDAGTPVDVYLKDNHGYIYHRVHDVYTENNTAMPYTALLAKRQIYVYNQTGASNEIRHEHTYDLYGNVTQTVNHGYYSEIGDERTDVNTYSYQTGDYIVGLKSSSAVHIGASTAGTKASEELYYYDGAVSVSTPPVRGDLTRTEIWDNKTNAYVRGRELEYDRHGNVSRSIDARGGSTSSTFDPIYHQFLTRVTDAMGHSVSTEWDFVLGLPTAITGVNGATTSTEYDVLGQKKTVTDAASHQTRWDYLDTGNPELQRVRTILPDGTTDGLWSEVYYDGLGRTYRVIKEGANARVSYVQEMVFNDATDRAQRVSRWHLSGDSQRWISHTYDGMGRLTSTTLPDGAASSIAYTNDFWGKTHVVATDELGHQRSSVYDAYGRVQQVYDTNGSMQYVTTFQHDVADRVIQTTDAQNNVTSYTFDSLGQKTSMTDPDLGTVTYTHDNGGLLLGQRDAKNQFIEFSYDALGRTTTKLVNGQLHTRWFYDEAGHGESVGRLTRVVHPAGSDSHSWNPLGLETSATQVIDGVAKTITTTYDALDRQRTVTYPDGEVVSYDYNSAGELSAVTSSRGMSYVSSMAWSPEGQLTAMHHGNGTTSSYGYDPDRAWLSRAHVRSPLGGPTQETSLYEASYQYDAAARVVATTQDTKPAARTVTYTYDDLGRLLAVGGAQSQAFTYDEVGTMTSNSRLGTYAYGDTQHKHAVTAAGPGLSYAYDANGNRISGDGRTYSWDAEDQLVSVTKDGELTTFAYGPGGHRVKKATATMTALYFGPLLEQVNGKDVQYYYAGPTLVAKREIDGGVTTWYHADRLGSTRLMTDDRGAEVKDYDYLPFGELDGASGTASNERGFTGHVTDAEDELIYMGARHYDPKLGSFLSPDSIVAQTESSQDDDAYSYCANNPVNNTDPSGHSPLGVGGSGGASVINPIGGFLPPASNDNNHFHADAGKNKRKAAARKRSERRKDVAAATKVESLNNVAGHSDTVIALPLGITIKSSRSYVSIKSKGWVREYVLSNGIIISIELATGSYDAGIKKDKDGHPVIAVSSDAALYAFQIASPRLSSKFLNNVQSTIRVQGPSAGSDFHIGRDGVAFWAEANAASITTILSFDDGRYELEGGLSYGVGGGVRLSGDGLAAAYGPVSGRVKVPRSALLSMVPFVGSRLGTTPWMGPYHGNASGSAPWMGPP